MEQKLYKTDFTEQDKKFVLSLLYNGDDSYSFINGVQQKLDYLAMFMTLL